MQALVAQGKEPTLKGVRELTLGSYDTVKVHLKRCLAELAEMRSDPLPAELQQKSDAYVRSLWALAKHRSEADLRSTRIAAEQSAKAAESELSYAQAEIARLEQNAISAAMQLATLSAGLEECRIQLAREQARNDTISKELIAEHESARQATLKAHDGALLAASLRAECLLLKEQLAASVRGRHPPRRLDRSG